jgi:hypothetical protein
VFNTRYRTAAISIPSSQFLSDPWSDQPKKIFILAFWVPSEDFSNKGNKVYGAVQNQHSHRLSGIYHVNRHGVQYLADFLLGDNNAHRITELELSSFSFIQPCDGGLNVLIDCFSNQTTITKVSMHLYWGMFGSVEETTRLIAAFETNLSVTDLMILAINNPHRGYYCSWKLHFSFALTKSALTTAALGFSY